MVLYSCHPNLDQMTCSVKWARILPLCSERSGLLISRVITNWTVVVRHRGQSQQIEMYNMVILKFSHQSDEWWVMSTDQDEILKYKKYKLTQVLVFLFAYLLRPGTLVSINMLTYLHFTLSSALLKCDDIWSLYKAAISCLPLGGLQPGDDMLHCAVQQLLWPAGLWLYLCG